MSAKCVASSSAISSGDVVLLPLTSSPRTVRAVRFPRIERIFLQITDVGA